MPLQSLVVQLLFLFARHSCCWIPLEGYYYCLWLPLLSDNSLASCYLIYFYYHAHLFSLFLYLSLFFLIISTPNQSITLDYLNSIKLFLAQIAYSASNNILTLLNCLMFYCTLSNSALFRLNRLLIRLFSFFIFFFGCNFLFIILLSFSFCHFPYLILILQSSAFRVEITWITQIKEYWEGITAGETPKNISRFTLQKQKDNPKQ